jgi:hypothetical protein
MDGEDEKTITYAAKGSTEIPATKTLNGRALKAGEFEFTISANEGAPMKDENGTDIDDSELTVKNTQDGDIIFPTFYYTESDIGKTYTYTVKEETGSLGGVTYDEAEFTVTVTIAAKGEDADEDGKDDLIITKTYSKSKTEGGVTWTTDVNSIDFTNEYDANGKIDIEGYE